MFLIIEIVAITIKAFVAFYIVFPYASGQVFIFVRH